MLGQKPLQAILHASRDHMRAHLGSLAAQLEQGTGRWILGEQYTLADVTWSCILLRLDGTGWLDHFLEDKALAPVKNYYAALGSRPSWKAAITDKTHPVVEQAKRDLKEAIDSDAKIASALYG